MRTRRVVALLLLMVIGLPMLDARTKAQGTYTVYPAGNDSCASWMSKPSESVSEVAVGYWLLGFVSGAGYGGMAMAETDGGAIREVARRHCRANPLDTVGDAATEVVRQLVQRKQKP